MLPAGSCAQRPLFGQFLRVRPQPKGAESTRAETPAAPSSGSNLRPREKLLRVLQDDRPLPSVFGHPVFFPNCPPKKSDLKAPIPGGTGSRLPAAAALPTLPRRLPAATEPREKFKKKNNNKKKRNRARAEPRAAPGGS